MSTAYDKIQAVRADLNRVLLEREQAIDLALLALLTRQNYVQIGPPGTAKSMLVDALHLRIDGARRFKRVLNPGTTDSDILGPIDLTRLADEGRYVRRHARSIVEADIVFLDEIGRANQMVYDLLLQILGEERCVDEIGMDTPLALPVLGSFAASNSHLTGDDNLQALNDRFLLRQEIAPLADPASLIRLATDRPRLSDVRATITLDELRQAQAEAQQVTLPTSMVEAALALKEALRGEGVLVTDRMFTWSFPLLKAHAYLQGEPHVGLEDLAVLGAAWWVDPHERAVVQRAIFSVATPLQAQALAIEDNAMDLIAHLPNADAHDFLSAAESANAQLLDMVQTLMQAIRGSAARDTTRQKAVGSLKRVHAAQTKLAGQLAARMGLGGIDLSGVLATTA